MHDSRVDPWAGGHAPSAVRSSQLMRPRRRLVQKLHAEQKRVVGVRCDEHRIQPIRGHRGRPATPCHFRARTREEGARSRRRRSSIADDDDESGVGTSLIDRNRFDRLVEYYLSLKQIN